MSSTLLSEMISFTRYLDTEKTVNQWPAYHCGDIEQCGLPIRCAPRPQFVSFLQSCELSAVLANQKIPVELHQTCPLLGSVLRADDGDAAGDARQLSDHRFVQTLLGQQEPHVVRGGDQHHGPIHKLVHVITREYDGTPARDVLLAQYLDGREEGRQNGPEENLGSTPLDYDRLVWRLDHYHRRTYLQKEIQKLVEVRSHDADDGDEGYGGYPQRVERCDRAHYLHGAVRGEKEYTVRPR